MDIETVHNFFDLCKALIAQGLWNDNFAEFGDNGLLGCSQLVYFYSRKWDRLGVVHVGLSALLVLAGWWDRFPPRSQKESRFRDRTEIANRVRYIC